MVVKPMLPAMTDSEIALGSASSLNRIKKLVYADRVLKDPGVVEI